MNVGKIKFPNLVEIRVNGSRGLFRREVLLERYVDNELVGSSWVREHDSVFISITLDISKGDPDQ